MQTSLLELTEPLSYKSFSVKNKREELFQRYFNKLQVNSDLNRSLVSFQENKKVPFYRWLKFKEGFSSKLVKYLLNHYKLQNDKTLDVLDPFAGSGTTVTTAIEQGNFATGIEILPVGTAAMKARLIADSVDIDKFQEYFEKYKTFSLKTNNNGEYKFPHVRITDKAFDEEAEFSISTYMKFLDSIQSEDVKYLFWFVCLSILEDISYTSKDGQYLRWDFRSGRNLKSKYQKTKIVDFHEAILEKLQLILYDIKRRNGGSYTQRVKIIEGSCLKELPLLKNNSFDLVITSPPYCNRYDYTRTYALELAFMGYDEIRLKELRQELLSASVENKTKFDKLKKIYDDSNRSEFFYTCVKSFNEQAALQEVLQILKQARLTGELNNNNIPTMVENYFFEMNIVIHELARILRPGGRIYMVNDNVQYIGEEIPVDLILSNFAENYSLDLNVIWVLSRGKGNSSQQMGAFGRNEIRKCVYVWDKIR